MSEKHSYIVGVDVGGTFTDLVLYERATATIRTVKVPSVRHAPDEAVLAALDKVGVPADTIDFIVHGTTVATNALLERRGARAALVTTAGFRDVLELGRTTRLVPNSLYDPYFRRPKPLIRRRDRHGVTERIGADGAIVVAFDPAEIEALALRLLADGVEAVAIGFLNSFRNPAHEQGVRAIFARHFEFVSISSEVLNEIREFDRFSAVAINIYVMPVMQRYVSRLTRALSERNPHTSFYTIASHGGLLTSSTVATQPVRTILSGPAAGVMSTVHLMQTLGIEKLITYDMGGTSTDVALITDGRFPLKRETILEGLVVHLAQLDIHTIGAGGGSIASLDAGGALLIGPDSAGAVPGPACYGRGGTCPTVTDANVALGRIGDNQELGGSLAVNRRAAEAAIGQLAREAGLSTAAMAEAILTLAVAKMTSAVHEISVARGFDPREFALLSYGGAGPLHACLVAAEIGIPRVIVPPAPGAFSAFGALCSALMKDRSTTLLRRLDPGALTLAMTLCRDLACQMQQEFAAEGINTTGYTAEYQFDLRYEGQAHEITVTIPPDADCAGLIELFERDFEREYGRRDVGRAVQIVTLRVLGRVATELPRWTKPVPAERHPNSGHTSTQRRLVCGQGTIQCPVYQRAQLAVDQRVTGPAIIEEMSSTIYVPPSWEAVVGRIGELDIRHKPAGSLTPPPTESRA